ncbi:MAG: 3'-5' exonuclease [Myxococcales bacterium]|nr:3'-5' exonuclease [Myxococcota bacterium]MDW8284343.1 3'-5' exonuclease [Myxococcales bacterium]
MPADSQAVLVFDVETTGLDKNRDQIIELGVLFGLDPNGPCRVWRFRPDVPIGPEAQAKHGLCAEDLAGEPPFGAQAAEIRTLFDRAEVLVGYNIGFDIEMLQAEFRRAGLAPLDIERKHVVDLLRLWHQQEPRTLQVAHRRFVGGEFSGAHSAGGDVIATARVLRGMVHAFGLQGRPLAELARLCEPDRQRWVGSSRHFLWHEGVMVVGFGQHIGKGVHELASGPERSYLEWMLRGNFPPHVKEICRAALQLDSRDFQAWAASTYPSRTPPG